MKTILTILVSLNLALAALSAEFEPGETSLYAIAGVNLSGAQPLKGRFSEGVGVQYMLTKTAGITAEIASQDAGGHAVDQCGGHVKGYLPFFKTGLYGYGELGYQHHFAGNRDYLSTGAGLEIRSKMKAYAGAGARVLEDFRTGAKVQPVLYVGWRF